LTQRRRLLQQLGLAWAAVMGSTAVAVLFDFSDVCLYFVDVSG
jgi:hypothetical protein